MHCFFAFVFDMNGMLKTFCTTGISTLLLFLLGISNTMSENNTKPEITLFVGTTGGAGNVDGMGIAARFTYPYGVAIDSAGNVYVADGGEDVSSSKNNNAIRKITPAGVVSTLAGTAGAYGNADGVGAAARFNCPRAVATDKVGNLYVADSGNHTLRKITPAGVVSTFAGTAGAIGNANGIGTAARFNYPQGVAIDSAGNLYVTDSGNDTLRKITPAGVVSTLAGTAGAYDSVDGVGAAARFKNPKGVATDIAGNIYVADDTAIRKITPAGIVSTFVGSKDARGSDDGIGAAARFDSVTGVAIDSAGNIYVADSATAIRKITPAGVVSTLAGTTLGLYHSIGSADGVGTAAKFDHPVGLATDKAGNVYVADSGNHAIRKITPAGVVSTFAGAAEARGRADGVNAAAQFNHSIDIATDDAGNVYVTDGTSVHKITPAGAVSTLSQARRGNHALGAVATDSAGNVYVADLMGGDNSPGGGYYILPAFFREKIFNSIRKITPSGAVHTLVGKSANLEGPQSIAADRAGNIYVADSGNHTIRKITPRKIFTASVTTFAGAAGVNGNEDGVGEAARFNVPGGVAIDSSGHIYVADSHNHTIRKITPTGMVTTLAGATGQRGTADGIGAAARFDHPRSLAIDSKGNIYVTDYHNQIVRKITSAGAVSTFAGKVRQVGFVAGALPGALADPLAVAVHGNSLYILMRNGVAVVSNLP